MLFNNDRIDMRKVFFAVWGKYQKQAPLEPLEQQLADIMLKHPEYYAILNNPDGNLDRDYLPEVGEANPFLHFALHQALFEQITTDRPAGILQTYKSLCEHLGDAHVAEHQMMDVLMQVLWQAQQQPAQAFDENIYLTQLQNLINHA